MLALALTACSSGTAGSSTSATERPQDRAREEIQMHDDLRSIFETVRADRKAFPRLEDAPAVARELTAEQSQYGPFRVARRADEVTRSDGVYVLEVPTDGGGFGVAARSSGGLLCTLVARHLDDEPDWWCRGA